MRRPARWRFIPPLCLLALLAVTGCSKAPPAPAASPESSGTEQPSQEAEARAQSQLRSFQSGGGDGGVAREGLEFQILNTSLLELIGERDFDNRYAATVMVEVDEPALKFSCSGVLHVPTEDSRETTLRIREREGRLESIPSSRLSSRIAKPS